jgi:SAM-dependent methyltransferase
MSVLDKQAMPVQPDPDSVPPVLFDARAQFAACFLNGEGLEIGALHLPLATPPHAEVRYVDRMPVDKLRTEYPELVAWNLTPVDVIDNGELLSTIPERSQDFIVANHFLEHCEDPIRTIGTHLGKLKPGGVLFYAVPDKRYTFDFRRTVTSLDHLIDDHEHGPERSRREHYDEWAQLVLVDETESPEETNARARKLEAAQYSIHTHVWTQAEFLRLILHCRERFDEAFDIEAAARQAIEFVVVLRKAGGSPTLPPPPPPPSTRHWRELPQRALAKARAASRRDTER